MAQNFKINKTALDAVDLYIGAKKKQKTTASTKTSTTPKQKTSQNSSTQEQKISGLMDKLFDTGTGTQAGASVIGIPGADIGMAPVSRNTIKEQETAYQKRLAQEQKERDERAKKLDVSTLSRGVMGADATFTPEQNKAINDVREQRRADRDQRYKDANIASQADSDRYREIRKQIELSATPGAQQMTGDELNSLISEGNRLSQQNLRGLDNRLESAGASVAANIVGGMWRTGETIAEGVKQNAMAEAMTAELRNAKSKEDIDTIRQKYKGMGFDRYLSSDTEGGKMLDYATREQEKATAGLSDTGKFFAEAGISTANFLTNLVAAGGNPAVVLGLFGAQSMGRQSYDTAKTYEGARENGYTDNLSFTQQMLSSATTGAIEAATEMLPLNYILNLARLGKPGLKNFAKGLLASAGIEGGEEAVNYTAGNLMNKMILGGLEDDFDFGQLAYSFGLGAVSGAGIAAPITSVNTIANTLSYDTYADVGRLYRLEGNDVDQLIRDGIASKDKEIKANAKAMLGVQRRGQTLADGDVGKLFLMMDGRFTQEDAARLEAMDAEEEARRQAEIAEMQAQAVQEAQNQPVSEDLTEVSNDTAEAQTQATQEPVSAPIKVGKVTTIQHPYEGEKPVQTQKGSTPVPEISQEAVDVETQRIEDSRAKAEAEGKSVRNHIRKIYENLFDKKGGQHTVTVENTTFGGNDYDVSVYKSAISKVVSDPKITAEKLAVLDILDDVIRSAEYVGSGRYVPKGNKTKQTKRFDYFENDVKIGDKDYVVSFDVEVFKDSNNYRTHKINEIKIDPVSATDPGPVPGAENRSLLEGDSASSPSSNDKLTQPEKIVNTSEESIRAERSAPEETVANIEETATNTQENVANVQAAEGEEETRTFVREIASNTAKPGLADNEASQMLNRDTRRFYDKLGRTLGVEIDFVEDIPGAGINGVYSNGHILVSLRAEDPYLTVVCHEITHHFERTAKNTYGKLQDHALKWYAKKNGIDLATLEGNLSVLRERLAATTDEGVKQEITAYYAQELLNTKGEIMALINEDVKTAAGFRDSMRAVFAKIKKAFAGESRAEMKTITEAENLWKECFREARANKGATKGTDGGVQMSLNPSFGRQIDEWDGKSNKIFSIGTTSNALKSIGVQDSKIVWYGKKIAEIIRKHEGMNTDIIKQVPNVIENPVIVLKSQNSESRIVMFGEVKDKNGAPVTAIIELQPTDKGGRILDMNVVASAYGKTSSPARFIENSDLLYLDENKKRTERWLNAVGLQLPSVALPAFGSIGRITYPDGKVKIEGVPYRDYMQGNDIQFSMSRPVEQTKSLIALHNLSELKLRKALKLGGFPMPSIAVTRKDIPHTNFGPISLIMRKSTIDPQASRKNDVYSADAWTPTFPQIEYEVNEKAAKRIRDKYYDLYEKYGHDATRALYGLGVTPEDTLNRNGGEEGVFNRLKDDVDLMKLYLMDTGKEVPETVTEEKVDRLDDDTIKLYDHFIDALGADVINEITPAEGQSPMQSRREWWSKHGDNFEAAYKEYIRGLGMTAQEADNVIENESVASMTRHILGARNYLRNGAEKRTTATNVEATNEAIRKATDQGEYENWLHGLMDGIEKSQGVYNGRDFYTASGNRRSFSATHYPVTLDNIAKAMANENDGDSRNVSGFHGVKTLRAGTSKRFKSIEDMHELEGRLKHLTQEEADELNEALSARLSSLMGDIYNLKEHGKYDNAFIEYDRIGEILEEIAEGGEYAPVTVKKIFAQYEYDLPVDMVKDIVELLFDVSQMPVNMFEAKPKRSVRFDEVAAAVVPENTAQDVTDGLEKEGVPVIRYTEGNEDDRLAKINEFAEEAEARGEDDIQFSLGNIQGEKGDYGLGVILDTDIFDGVKPRNWGKILSNFVYNNLAGESVVVYNDDGEAERIWFARKNDRVRKDGSTSPRKVIDKLARYKGDNIRAYGTVHLDEALIASNKIGENRENIHQWLDQNGWEFRNVYLQDKSGNIYSATLNIAAGRDRKILYDITNIREIDKKESPASDVPSAHEVAHGASASRDSNGKVSQESGVVKSNGKNNSSNGAQASTAGGREALEDIGALIRERNKLKRDFERLKAQMKPGEKGVRSNDVKRITKDILNDYLYEGRLNTKSMATALEGLYNGLENGTIDFFGDAFENARMIARAIAGAAVMNSNSLVEDDYRIIREALRRAPIRMPKEDLAEERVRDTMRRLKGEVRFNQKNGLDIDVFYKELASLAPGYFPEDVLTASDQLNHIEEVLESLRPLYVQAYGENEAQTDEMGYALPTESEAVERIAQDILERYFDTRTNAPTFADKQNAKMQKQRSDLLARIGSLNDEIDTLKTNKKGSAARIDGLEKQMKKLTDSLIKLDNKFLATQIYDEAKRRKEQQAHRNKVKALREGTREEKKNAISELKEWHKAEMSVMRDEMRKQSDDLKATKKRVEIVERVLDRERKRWEKQLQATKDKFKAKDKTVRENQKKRELIARIQRHTSALGQKLLKPSDNKHIPETLRKPVAQLLSSLDLGSAYAVDYLTGERIARSEAGLDSIQTKRTKAALELRDLFSKAYDEASTDYLFITDPDLVMALDELAKLADVPIGDMTLEQLENVWYVMRGIEGAVSSMDKMIGNARYSTVSALAEQVRRGVNISNRVKEPTKIGKLLKLDMLTPEAFFHRLGRGGDDLFRMLRAGQDKQIKILDDIRKNMYRITGNVDIKALEKENHTFTINGETVTLSKAQIMSLYCLSNRQQAKLHISEGGIKPSALKEKKLDPRRTTQVTPVPLSEEDLNEIFSTMTGAEKALADQVQNYMSNSLSRYGNEASMEVYGYKKFNEKKYFPIRVDSDSIAKDDAMKKLTQTIAGKGMAKQTVEGARQPIIIESIFDVMAQHASDMAAYAAFLAPMENLKRVKNFRFDEENNRRDTMPEIIKSALGNGGMAYLNQLITDINQKASGDNSFTMDNLLGTYKASAVGGNLRVILQQPTAILRALAEINPAYLLRGAVKVASNPVAAAKSWQRAKKYAPIALWKSWGYFDAQTGRTVKSIIFDQDTKFDRVKETLLAPIGWADSLTWTVMWDACEAKHEADMKRRYGEAIKDDAFYEGVAREFERIIDRTQVVDGVLQRSQIMRSSQTINKMSTAFMSEPTKLYNMILSGVWDYTHSEKGSTARKQSARKLGVTVAAACASVIVNAFVQSLVDGMRDDDREKKYWQRVLKQYFGEVNEDKEGIERYGDVLFKGNLAQVLNPITYIPYVKDVWSIMQGYSVDRMDMESISNILGALKNAYKAFDPTTKNTGVNAAITVIGEASRFLGLPVSNLVRDAKGVAISAFNEAENYYAMYKYDKLFYKMNDANLSRFVAQMMAAKDSGNVEDYDMIYRDLKKNGFDDAKLTEKATDYEKKKQGVTKLEDLEERVLIGESREKYDATMKALKSSSAWKSATADDRDKIETRVYQYAKGLEGESAKVATARKNGMSASQYYINALADKNVTAQKEKQKEAQATSKENAIASAERMSGKKAPEQANYFGEHDPYADLVYGNANGGVSMDEMRAYLKASNFTDEQKDAIWYGRWPKTGKHW